MTSVVAGRIDQAVAREATPGFEFVTNAGLDAHHGDEIARAGTTKRGN